MAMCHLPFAHLRFFLRRQNTHAFREDYRERWSMRNGNSSHSWEHRLARCLGEGPEGFGKGFRVKGADAVQGFAQVVFYQVLAGRTRLAKITIQVFPYSVHVFS